MKWLSNHRRQLLPYLLVLLPVVASLCYVKAFGVDLAWRDDLGGHTPTGGLCNGTLQIFEKWHNGSLRFADFWELHSEHRIPFPYLLMFVSGLLTQWNTFVEMYMTQVLLLVTLGVCLAAFRRESPPEGRVWLMIPISFLVFDLRQNDCLLFGMAVGIIMVVSGVAVAFFCLYRLNTPERRPLKFAGAVVAATVATFSSAQGLMVWPVGLVPLLLLPLERRSKLLLSALWIALGAIEWRLYFLDYVKPPWHPAYGFTWEYFLTLLGCGLFNIESIAAIAGVLILLFLIVAIVLVLKDPEKHSQSLWYALIIYGLLVQVNITITRSGFGPGQALSSRYSTYSIFMLLGLYAIFARHFTRTFNRLTVLPYGALLGLLSIGLVAATQDAYQVGKQSKLQQEYYRYLFFTYESQPDAILWMGAGPRPPELQEYLGVMKALHLNLFTSADLAARYTLPDPHLPVLSSSAQSVLNRFELNPSSGLVEVYGWAIDPVTKQPVGGILLEIDGKRQMAYYGAPREDVAQHFKSRSALNSGFIRHFSVSQLGAGRHQMIVWVLTPDRKAFYMPVGTIELNIPG